MSKKNQSLEVTDLNQEFPQISRLVRDTLKKHDVSETLRNETMLVMEAVCSKITEQKHEDTPVSITIRSNLGQSSIIIIYKGEHLDIDPEEHDNLSPEDMVINAYAEKIDTRFEAGYNRVLITVKRNRGMLEVYCFAAAFAAMIIGCIIISRTSADVRTDLLDNVLYPIERLLVNGVLMVGAPVTLLSLLRNLTTTYILSERDSGARALGRIAIFSSIGAVILAVAVSFIWSYCGQFFVRGFSTLSSIRVSLNIKNIVMTIMPSDIITPFQSISPFPLLVIAGITTYSMCSVGKHFDRLKLAIDALYALFSRMLSVVMSLMPLAAFVAVIDLLIRDGIASVIYIIEMLVAVILSLPLLFITYMVRLRIHGIRGFRFLEKVFPVYRENNHIASALDAVPFNIRYCVRTFKMDLHRLQTSMPLMAQINLDGNCYILTMVGLMVITLSGERVSVIDVVTLAMLVFFLSLGAPNQPGSLLIGMMLFINYWNALDMVSLAICCEVFLGSVLNLINITGDVVAIAIKEVGFEDSSFDPELLVKKR